MTAHDEASDDATRGARAGGVTTISSATVNRIAGRAAIGAPGVVKARVSGAPSECEPGAQASMRLTVNASLAYPEPLGATIEHLRTTLKRELRELLGIARAVRVDVVVDELLPPRSYRPRARVR